MFCNCNMLCASCINSIKQRPIMVKLLNAFGLVLVSSNFTEQDIQILYNYEAFNEELCCSFINGMVGDGRLKK